MLLERITNVPLPYFNAAVIEAKRARWDQEDQVRKMSSVFNTSTSIALRIHDAPLGHHTVFEYGEFVDCRDTPLRAQYPAMNLLVNWMYKTVKGMHLGRIQLVKLFGQGKVPLHIDPGTYFDVHDRFHVPLITDEKTVFMSDVEEGVMPLGVLCRLNNRGLHGVRNESTNDRVHLIVDIQTKDHPWKSA